VKAESFADAIFSAKSVRWMIPLELDAIAEEVFKD